MPAWTRVTFVGGASGGLVARNILVRSGRFGVSSIEGANPTILRNTIVDTGDCGLYTSDADPMLERNIITRSANYGIACFGTRMPGIGCNVIYESANADYSEDCPSAVGDILNRPHALPRLLRRRPRLAVRRRHGVAAGSARSKRPARSDHRSLGPGFSRSGLAPGRPGCTVMVVRLRLHGSANHRRAQHGSDGGTPWRLRPTVFFFPGSVLRPSLCSVAARVLATCLALSVAGSARGDVDTGSRLDDIRAASRQAETSSAIPSDVEPGMAVPLGGDDVSIKSGGATFLEPFIDVASNGATSTSRYEAMLQIARSIARRTEATSGSSGRPSTPGTSSSSTTF